MTDGARTTGSTYVRASALVQSVFECKRLLAFRRGGREAMRLHFRGFTTELEDKRLMYCMPDCQTGDSVKNASDAVHVGLIRNKAEASLKCREGQTMHERAFLRSWRHTALTRKINGFCRVVSGE
jgi:hypothetical protein